MNPLIAQVTVLIVAPLAVCRASVPGRPGGCPANFLRKLACHSMCDTIGMARFHGECVAKCCGGAVVLPPPPPLPAMPTAPPPPPMQDKAADTLKETVEDDVSANKTQTRTCCVTVYERFYFRGRSMLFCDAIKSVGTNWNDRLHSFSVPAGCKVTLYEHVDFGGERYGPYENDVDFFWHMQEASSVIVEPLESVNTTSSADTGETAYSGYDAHEVPEEHDIFANDTEAPTCCATIYEHANFRGTHINHCGNVDWVTPGWTSRFGSLIAERGCNVTLFEHTHFHGRKFGPFVNAVNRLEYESHFIHSVVVE